MGLRHDLPLLSLAPSPSTAMNPPTALSDRLLLSNRHQQSVHLEIDGHFGSAHSPTTQPAQTHPIRTGGLRRRLTPLDTVEAELGLDAISEVGPSGQFFGCSHTMAHYETAFYSPMLSD